MAVEVIAVGAAALLALRRPHTPSRPTRRQVVPSKGLPRGDAGRIVAEQLIALDRADIYCLKAGISHLNVP